MDATTRRYISCVPVAKPNNDEFGPFAVKMRARQILAGPGEAPVATLLLWRSDRLTKAKPEAAVDAMTLCLFGRACEGQT